MSGVFIFLLVFFLVFMMSGPLKKGKKTFKPDDVSRERIKNWAKTQAGQSVQSDYQSRSDRKKSATSLARANQARMGAIALKRGADRLDGMDSVRDPNDKNRNRRADWGSRAGPGILSLKNTVILIVAGLIFLWMISQFSVS